jgi:hypothetical protein
MAKKTVIRRLAKSLALSPEVHDLVNEAEEGETIDARPTMVQVGAPSMRAVDFALPPPPDAAPPHDPRTGEVIEPSEDEKAEILAGELAAAAPHPVDALLQEVARAPDGKALDVLTERAARELGPKEPRRGDVTAAIDARRRQLAPRNG